MKPPAPTAARPTVAARFRIEIERAASEGVPLDGLALHLTAGDVGQLKRDRTLAVADISFGGGVMRFLGVKVVKGEGPSSELRRLAAEGP